ncbi:MAG: methyltransferase domain-containing protein [Candidatus Hodarchaeales archaeon]
MKRKNNIDQKTGDDYSFGYNKGVLDYLICRAQKSFDFILPHLKPELEVLECGCGPGVVTFEIAKEVINGSVIGIDIDKDLIDSNNKKVDESKIKNLKFEVANILELPYPDNFFDIVYMQALIVHIKNPVNAIREIHRVLKSNGLILLREPIMDRTIMSPEEPLLLEAIELVQRAIRSYGGDSSVGRKLWPLLNEVGFRGILISSKWGQPDSLDEWTDFYEGWAEVYRGKIGDIILEEGWADEKHLTEMSNAFLNLGKNKKGYAAAPWGEAVGRK